MLGYVRSETIRRSDGWRKQEPDSKAMDAYLNARSWDERSFDTAVVVDGAAVETPTHKIDNLKNRTRLS